MAFNNLNFKLYFNLRILFIVEIQLLHDFNKFFLLIFFILYFLWIVNRALSNCSYRMLTFTYCQKISIILGLSSSSKMIRLIVNSCFQCCLVCLCIIIEVKCHIHLRCTTFTSKILSWKCTNIRCCFNANSIVTVSKFNLHWIELNYIIIVIIVFNCATIWSDWFTFISFISFVSVPFSLARIKSWLNEWMRWTRFSLWNYWYKLA